LLDTDVTRVFPARRLIVEYAEIPGKCGYSTAGRPIERSGFIDRVDGSQRWMNFHKGNIWHVFNYGLTGELTR